MRPCARTQQVSGVLPASQYLYQNGLEIGMGLAYERCLEQSHHKYGNIEVANTAPC
jgi:hypothetical protein